MFTQTDHNLKAFRELASDLYMAEDEDVLTIVNAYFEQPVTSWYDFECVMEDMPTWFIDSVYKVWYNAPESQHIVEAFFILGDIYRARHPFKSIFN